MDDPNGSYIVSPDEQEHVDRRPLARPISDATGPTDLFDIGAGAAPAPALSPGQRAVLKRAAARRRVAARPASPAGVIAAGVGLLVLGGIVVARKGRR